MSTSDLFGLDALEMYTNAISIQEQVSQMDYSCRRTFLTYLQEEFQPLDDEFDDIVTTILDALKLLRPLDAAVEKLSSTYSYDSIRMVLQSIQDYLHDCQCD